MGIRGPFFKVLQEFIWEGKRCVGADGKVCHIEPVLSNAPQESDLDPLLIILFTTDLGNDLENKVVSYADDTTHFESISKPSDRIGVAGSLNRNLAKIQSWWELWGMQLNLKKHSMIMSWSRTA